MAIDELWLANTYNSDKLLPIKVDKLSPFYNPHSALGVCVPNTTIIECLHALIYLFQQRFPSRAYVKPVIQSLRNGLYNYEAFQYSLYLFLKVLIKYLGNMKFQPFVSETTFNHVSELWLAYIEPWEQNVVLNELSFNANLTQIDLSIHGNIYIILDNDEYLRSKQISLENAPNTKTCVQYYDPPFWTSRKKKLE